jgi:glycosyltransferase involved in cell wall biosynthesis
MLALPPEAQRALGNAARQRVNQNYEIGVIAQRYAETYTALVRQGLTARY